jgi:Photosynthetic reaction centre cytochrome C subunit
LEFSSVSFPALTSAILSAAITVTAAAQSAASPKPASAPPHEHQHPMPAPTNLKVLPKTLTGEQVHEIMHSWEAALGTECSTCHTADAKNIGPNGKPRLNYADDSKPEKAAARLMVTMVDQINTQYVAKIENSGAPVTCGTCHRGHLDPAPFTPPPGHEHHEHAAPGSSSESHAVPN